MSAHTHVQLQCNIFHIFPKDDKLSCKGSTYTTQLSQQAKIQNYHIASQPFPFNLDSIIGFDSR